MAHSTVGIWGYQFQRPLYPRGSECGTWIVRDGMSQEVHRNARGTKLEPGDEIHFGKAVVIFEA